MIAIADSYQLSANLLYGFGHNPASQIVSRTCDNAAPYAFTGYVSKTLSYAANGLNQYGVVGESSYSCDSNGNLTSDGTIAYSCDAENRLVATSAGAGLTYDPLERLYRAGKSFTPKGKREVAGERARETGGNPSCVDCEKDTNNPKKTERGDRRDPRERNVDHIIDRAKGGDGSPSNGAIRCFECSLKKPPRNQMTKKKMTFFLEKDEDGYPPDDSETVWVEELKGNRYRIDNIPFYIRDISPEDIVTGHVIDGNLLFNELISKSTISVFRIVFFDKSKVEGVLSKLVVAGCRWEGSHLANFYSVELPRSADIQTIRETLDIEASNDVLDYEEASIRSR